MCLTAFSMGFFLLLSIAAFGQSGKFAAPARPAGTRTCKEFGATAQSSHSTSKSRRHTTSLTRASVIGDPPFGELPYLAAALQQANDNHIHRERDPTGDCHMHGVLHSLVPPCPTEIVEDSNYVVEEGENDRRHHVTVFKEAR